MAADADARFLAAVQKLQMVCETSGELREDSKQSILEAITELRAAQDEYKVTIQSLKTEQLKKFGVSLSTGPNNTVGTFTEVAVLNGDFELETVKKNVTREDPISTMKKIASIDSPHLKTIGSALMQETYSKRKRFIFVKAPLLASIKEVYPLLFSTNEIKNELDRTFYAGMCDAFMEQIDKYSNAILTLCDPSNPIYQRTMNSIECCLTEQQNKYAEAVGSILVLPSLVDETIDFVYTSDNSKENAIFPYIDAHLHSLKALFFDNMLFKIVTEKQLVCEATNFKEAVLCLVACYFIFNINYMESCEDTLVVFEKLYLRANHTSDISERAENVIKMVRLKAGS